VPYVLERRIQWWYAASGKGTKATPARVSDDCLSKTEFSLAIRESPPGGGHRGILRFGLLTMVQTTYGGRTAAQRSDREMSAGTIATRVESARYLVLGGLDIPVTLDDRGTVTGAEVESGAAAAREKVLGVRATGLHWRDYFEPWWIADFLAAGLTTSPLPEGEVSPETEWSEDETCWDGPDEGPLVFRRRFRVARIEEKEVSFEATGNVLSFSYEARPPSLKPPDPPKRSPPGDHGRVDIGSSSVSTHVRLSREDGLPLLVETEAKMDYKDALGIVPRLWTFHSKLERVKAWPSGRPFEPPVPKPPGGK
jgi:hypothetical protein